MKEINKGQKGFLLASSAALLLSSGFVATELSAKHTQTKVRCEGIQTSAGSCGGPNGCSGTKTTSKITTLQECRKLGGDPIILEGHSESSGKKLKGY